MRGWAVDIGTTNTGIACWDDAKGQPRLIELPRVCRRPGGDDPLEAPVRSLGVRRLRFVDEPLAAALGYGLGIASDRNVLVVDIGGGTMHVALLRLTAGGVEQGRAEILAKQGRALGGDTVDSWLLDHVASGYVTLATSRARKPIRPGVC